MRKRILTACLLSLLFFASALAHDLFLKLDSYFVKVNQKVSISVMNGTYQKSEGAVTFARLTDLSVVSPSGAVSRPVETDLTKNETTAFVNFIPKETGNYVSRRAIRRLIVIKLCSATPLKWCLSKILTN